MVRTPCSLAETRVQFPYGDYIFCYNEITIIDKWSILNGIKVNKNKTEIIILKNGIKEKDNIDGYPIIREYKYLGILINFKMNIQNHIGMINKKLDE